MPAWIRQISKPANVQRPDVGRAEHTPRSDRSRLPDTRATVRPVRSPPLLRRISSESAVLAPANRGRGVKPRYRTPFQHCSCSRTRSFRRERPTTDFHHRAHPISLRAVATELKRGELSLAVPKKKDRASGIQTPPPSAPAPTVNRVRASRFKSQSHKSAGGPVPISTAARVPSGERRTFVYSRGGVLIGSSRPARVTHARDR